MAIAEGTGELYNAIVSAITKAFEDIMLNFTLNSFLDGNLIYSREKHYMLKQVRASFIVVVVACFNLIHYLLHLQLTNLS